MINPTKRITIKSIQRLATLLIAVLVFMLTGCNARDESAIAIVPPQPTNTLIQMASVHIPDIERGRQAWLEQRCDDCHGPIGSGGIGPMLAATPLSYEDFLHLVRTAAPPKPAYSVEMLFDEQAYDIYAWLCTQRTCAAPAIPTNVPCLPTPPSIEDAMGMTVWAHSGCISCHGVFAQGGPEAPLLAGLTYPVKEELARMRRKAGQIPEHSSENMRDEIFVELYKWLQAGCSYSDACEHR